MKFKRNASGRGGYLQGENFSIAYRGFKVWNWRPYFSLTPLHIGSVRLYRLGPVALFLKKNPSHD